MPKVLITTVPFAEHDRRPLELLAAAGAEVVINPLGRKLKAPELAELAADVDILIAGTEPITEEVMRRASRLRLISRVGVGLDGVDLLAAERHGVRVSYTADAPAPAVAELTIGLMLVLLRSIHVANDQLHAGNWQRIFGRRIPEVTIGLIGLGRIGQRVATCLAGFGSTRVLAHDIQPPAAAKRMAHLEWAGQDALLRDADVVSLHVPLTADTHGMIRREHLMQMKPDALLINTARGGIVHEADLAEVMTGGHLGGAAIDVFEEEPYHGPLAAIPRCVLTSHMGSMSIDCRTRMEIEATEEAVRFLTGQPLTGAVPADEYNLRRPAQ